MFSDYSSEIVEFPSTWKTEKKLRESGSQTSETLTYAAESQTYRPRHAECQTESLLELMNTSESLRINVNETTLQKFLLKAESLVSKQLIVNVSAASLYSGIFRERDQTSEMSISCEHILEEASITKSADSGNQLEVTCISWSSSGASVAVAYGTNKNVAWSETRSYLCLWNLDRPKLQHHVCDQKLELESSIQTISFHPQFAGFIAAGLFSGAVVLWDVAKDDVMYSSSAHEDPVTSLRWMEQQSPKYLQLLSVSTDGKLMIWKHRKGKDSTAMKLEKKFKIRGTHLPRRAGIKGTGAVGITCISSGKGEVDEMRRFGGLMTSGVLIVGCENGAVLKCDVDTTDDNPVTFTYEGHVGPVYSADWSPFHRHLFLTCSTDQACRIYHALQASPLRDIRPEEAVGSRVGNYLYAAYWSLTRPLLFYVAGTRGRIEACDVSTCRCVVFTDVTGGDGKACVVTSMQLNHARPNLLATGSTNFLIHVLSLGSRLVEGSDTNEESKLLEQLANEAMASE